jgi:hypothetical protein
MRTKVKVFDGTKSVKFALESASWLLAWLETTVMLNGHKVFKTWGARISPSLCGGIIRYQTNLILINNLVCSTETLCQVISAENWYKQRNSTVNACPNFGPHVNSELVFPNDLLSPKRVLLKNEEHESCRQIFHLQIWFCSFLIHYSSKEASERARKVSTFLWGSKLDAFTVKSYARITIRDEVALTAATENPVLSLVELNPGITTERTSERRN